MKFLNLLIPFSIVLTSCSSEKYFASGLHKFPVFGKKEKVKLYYRGEDLPERDFIKVVNFNFQMKGEVSSETCLEMIKTKAKNANVDAVIDIHEHVNSYIGMTGADILFSIISAFSEDDDVILYESEIKRTYISGIGIKFADNIISSDNIIKIKELYFVRNDSIGSNEKFCTFYQNIAGGTDSTIYSGGQVLFNVLNEYFLPFTDNYLFEAKDGWSYRLDSYGKLKSRRKGNIVFTYKYNQANKLKMIRFRNDALAQTAKIYVKLDNKNRVQSKTIVRNNCQLAVQNKYRHGRLVYQDMSYTNDQIKYDFFILTTFYTQEELIAYVNAIKKSEHTLDEGIVED